MSNGLAKLQLLIELKNKLKSGLDTAKKQVEKATGSIQSKLDAFKLSNIKAFDAIEERVPGMSSALSMLSNPYIALTAIVLGLGAGIAKTTMMANDWHTQLAKVNVTAGLSQNELGKLSDKLLEIGGNNVAPLEQVPEAFNRIISAGLSVNDSLATLEPTLRAAKAGFADIETVAAAAVSVMQSSGQDANKVYDVLFATLNKGNAEFKDIAQYLPKVIPVARAVGFELGETAGAFASLTTKLSSEQSTTALEGIMRALGKDDMVKKFEGMGVKIFDDKGKARPLLQIVTDMQKQMSGLTDKQRMLKFDKLGLDDSAKLGFSTMIQDIPALKAAIDATVNSQGALNKAYADSITPVDEFLQTMNLLKVKAIEIGEIFLPVLSAIGKGALFVVQNLDVIGGVVAGLAVAWSILNAKVILAAGIQGVYAVATGIATAAQWAFNVAANANPIGLIVLAVGALIGGLVVAYNKFDKFRAIMQGTWEVVKGFGTILKDFVIDRIKGIISGLGSMAKAIGLLFKGDFSGAGKAAVQGLADFNGITAAKNALESSKKLKGTFTNKYSQSLAESKKKKEAEATLAGGKSNAEGVATTTTGGSSIAAETAKSVGSGSQTKNITINIDSFIKGYTPQHQSVNGMNKDELERWFTEMFLRVARSAEMAQ
jgi:TP901 family phage tail tape measure protein